MSLVSCARAVVLDHLVGVQDVGADLVAPAGLDVLPLEHGDLGLALGDAALEQAGAEDLHRRLAVLVLRALVLALGHDARREVGEAHGRVGLVDVLPAGALGAERLDAQLVVGDLADLGVVLDLGQHLDEGERRVAPLLGVERADAHEPVDAPLGTEEAVGAPTGDRDRHALEAGLLPFELVEDLGREAVALGPAQVHPQQHLGPVGGLGAAGAGADREDGVASRRTGPENSRLVRRALVVASRGSSYSCSTPVVELRVVRRRGQLGQLGEVVGARLDAAPGRRAPRAGRRPRAARAAPRAGRDQKSGWDARSSSARQLLCLGGRSKTPRGRVDPGDQVSDQRVVHRTTGCPVCLACGGQPRARRSWSSSGRSSMILSAVLLRATTGFTQGQYPLCGHSPQLPSQSSHAA